MSKIFIHQRDEIVEDAKKELREHFRKYGYACQVKHSAVEFSRGIADLLRKVVTSSFDKGYNKGLADGRDEMVAVDFSGVLTAEEVHRRYLTSIVPAKIASAKATAVFTSNHGATLTRRLRTLIRGSGASVLLSSPHFQRKFPEIVDAFVKQLIADTTTLVKAEKVNTPASLELPKAPATVVNKDRINVRVTNSNVGPEVYALFGVLNKLGIGTINLSKADLHAFDHQRAGISFKYEDLGGVTIEVHP